MLKSLDWSKYSASNINFFYMGVENKSTYIIITLLFIENSSIINRRGHHSSRGGRGVFSYDVPPNVSGGNYFSIMFIMLNSNQFSRTYAIIFFIPYRIDLKLTLSLPNCSRRSKRSRCKLI